MAKIMVCDRCRQEKGTNKYVIPTFEEKQEYRTTLEESGTNEVEVSNVYVRVADLCEDCRDALKEMVEAYWKKEGK